MPSAMSQSPNADADDLGVVDPIRAPEVLVDFGRRLRALPLYALGFLLAAIIRTVLLVADWAVTAGMPGLDPGSSLLSLVVGILPGTVLLLVPVAVAWSSERDSSAPERVVRGSIAVGLSELANVAAGSLGAGDVSSMLVSTAVSLGGNLLLGGGLIWMAQGLEALRETEPRSITGRVALLVAAMGAAVVVVQLVVGVAALVGAIPGPGADEFDQALFIGRAAGLTAAVPVLGWAFLAWVLIRGRDDLDRQPMATRGAMSGWLAGAWFLASIIATLLVVPYLLGSPDGLGTAPPGGSIYVVASLLGAVFSAGAVYVLAWSLASGLATDVEVDVDPVAADEGAATR